MPTKELTMIQSSIGEVIERMYQLRHELKADPVKQNEVHELNEKLLGVLNIIHEGDKI